MTYAQLRKEGVYRANLHARATAAISQFCGVYVILPIRDNERQGFESRDDVAARTWAGKTLQQFLEYQPRGDHDLATLKGATEDLHLGRSGIAVAPQGERPDARVDEQRHPRERSAL